MFEEVRVLEYLGTSITVNIKLVKKYINRETASDRQRYYGLQHILKHRIMGSIYEIETYDTTLNPVVWT